MNAAELKVYEHTCEIMGFRPDPAVIAEATASDPSMDGPGGGDPQDLTVALGHYAEPVRLDIEDGWGNSRELAEGAFLQRHHGDVRALSGFKIGEAYGGAIAPDEQGLGDLSTADGRLAAASSLTQETKAGSGNQTCGPSALIGGALLAGGKNGEGLVDLMDGMEHEATGEERERLAKLDAGMREKLKKGEPLTVGEMHALQGNLYGVMRNGMEDHADDDTNTGINSATMNKFLADNPALKERFEKNHMGVSYVDTDEEAGGDHFVIRMQDDKHNDVGVYDPAARQTGQIVTNSDEIDDYRRVQTKWIDGNAA